MSSTSVGDEWTGVLSITMAGGGVGVGVVSFLQLQWGVGGDGHIHRTALQFTTIPCESNTANRHT